MRADRNQSLLVQSREVAKDIPFLEGVQYRGAKPPPHERRLVDLRETWIGNGEAVYGGMKCFIGLCVVAVFVAIIVNFFNGPSCSQCQSVIDHAQYAPPTEHQEPGTSAVSPR